MEYGGGEYLWIGQAEVVAAPVITVRPDIDVGVSEPFHIVSSFLQNFDNSFAFEPALDASMQLKKGMTHLFVVKAIITEPVTDVTFTVSNPLGFDVRKVWPSTYLYVPRLG